VFTRNSGDCIVKAKKTDSYIYLQLEIYELGP